MKLRSRLVYRLYAIGLVQLLLVAVAALGIAYAMAKSPPRWDMQSITSQLSPLFEDPPALKRELEQLRKRHGLLLSVYDEERRLVATNVEPPLHPPRFGVFPPPGASGLPLPLPPPELIPHEPLEPPPGLIPHEPLGPPPGLIPHEPLGPPPDHLVAPLPFGHGPTPGLPAPFNQRVRARLPPPHMYTAISVLGREGVLVARFEHPRPSLWLASLTLAAGLVVVGVGAFMTSRWIGGPLRRLSRASVALGEGDLNARTGLTRSDEIGELAHAFDNMADRIQALRHAEKELLANVAHELRTPLSRIRVALEIAAEGDADAAKTSLSEITVDLSELEALVDDVLNATRFELADGKPASSRFSLHLEHISPVRIAERAAERFRNRHPERPFSLSAAPDVPDVEADPVLLRRVLDNLLENSHKYSPEAGSPIELRVSREENAACFEVNDHGMGIASADLPHVFDAFFRGERSRSRGTGGVGLGLTLAKRIVEAHAGTISVRSNIGEGTQVSVRLPATESPATI